MPVLPASYLDVPAEVAWSQLKFLPVFPASYLDVPAEVAWPQSVAVVSPNSALVVVLAAASVKV